MAFLALAILAAVMSACASSSVAQVIDSPSAPSSAIPLSNPTPDPTPDAVSLDEDIGSVLAISWYGHAITPQVESLLVDHYVGTVLLFSQNFSGPDGLRAVSDSLTALSAARCLDLPVLVSLDEEGGRVNRVQAPFAPPSQQSAGSGGAENVRLVEQHSAAGLRALGVGLNLAPVADVRTNPNDAVIGDRSFGSSPAHVAPLVAAAVTGLHQGGVAATLKHFPGLGGAAGDPHFAIPTDNESLAQWQAVQEPSFAAGVSAGADAVMTTAVYVPRLDSGRLPAMFSPAIVALLRGQLGFGGVVISDSVSMGGIGAVWPLPQATVMALAAGNDLVLLGSVDGNYELSVVAAVRAAVLSGRLDRNRLHESAMRVNALRARWGRHFLPCRRATAS